MDARRRGIFCTDWIFPLSGLETQKNHRKNVYAVKYLPRVEHVRRKPCKSDLGHCNSWSYFSYGPSLNWVGNRIDINSGGDGGEGSTATNSGDGPSSSGCRKINTFRKQGSTFSASSPTSQHLMCWRINRQRRNLKVKTEHFTSALMMQCNQEDSRST